MEQLFSRIPEVADLFEDIFEGKPSWVTPAYDQESNGRHHRATTTYALLIDESGRMTVDDIAAFPGAIREIIQVSSRSSASHFRVAIVMRAIVTSIDSRPTLNWADFRRLTT
jgi:hypothetical protein